MPIREYLSTINDQISHMHLYPQLSDFHPWLNLNVLESTEKPASFFPALVQVLNWPENTASSWGSRKDVLQNLGVQSGDYVVLPNLSPIAWAEAVKALGADCILIDHQPNNWQIDLDLLEEFLMNYTMLNERDELILKKDSRIIRSIIIPHLLGGMCDMDRLAFIALRFNLSLGEDITQALGSSWKHKPAGSFGMVNYCDFRTNPIFPFGPPVVFSMQSDTLELKQTELRPMDQLAHQIGAQLVSKIPDIITSFRKLEADYRKVITHGKLEWMTSVPDNQTNGLSAAFTSPAALDEGVLPLGQLSVPVYQEKSFHKSLYIRREDWATKLFETVKILPLRFRKNELIEKAKTLF